MLCLVGINRFYRMGSPTHGLSPVLPGAWASSWTLSPEQGSLDAEKTPRLLQSQMSDISPLSWQYRESPGPSPSKMHDANAQVTICNTSLDLNAHTDNDVDTLSVNDDSSVTSDDFYSFISQQVGSSLLLF